MNLIAYLDSIRAENASAATDAEARAGAWLGKANAQREAGRDDSISIRKAQYWLDRANWLRGNN